MDALHGGMCGLGAAFFESGLTKNTFLCGRFPVKWNYDCKAVLIPFSSSGERHGFSLEEPGRKMPLVNSNNMRMSSEKTGDSTGKFTKKIG